MFSNAFGSLENVRHFKRQIIGDNAEALRKMPLAVQVDEQNLFAKLGKLGRRFRL